MKHLCKHMSTLIIDHQLINVESLITLDEEQGKNWPDLCVSNAPDVHSLRLQPNTEL